MKVRALLLALVVAACSRQPPPPLPAAPLPPPAVAGHGSADPPNDRKPIETFPTSKSAPAQYRAASDQYIDPATLGSGKHNMVVSESPDASKAGHALLAAGGNAVDAAVATAFALAVSHPSAGNLGGGGFAVIRTGAGKAVALDFRETAPAAATPDMFLDKAGNPTVDSLRGDRAVGVPGSVAGL
ncbi:MAG TPA: gamma-glutamyltransferase, partial [Kofleriaceae bacterium]